MLTETLSGKCPCCDYDKLVQRYGSLGYNQMDGCPKCGFGYSTNSLDTDLFGVDAWIEYGIHAVALSYAVESIDASYEMWVAAFKDLNDLQKRIIVFNWTLTQERCDDVKKTIFVYSKEDVQAHLATKPIILNP